MIIALCLDLRALCFLTPLSPNKVVASASWVLPVQRGDWSSFSLNIDVVIWAIQFFGTSPALQYQKLVGQSLNNSVDSYRLIGVSGQPGIVTQGF